MLNGSFDVVNLGPAKVFLTSGVGITRDKISCLEIFILNEATSGIAAISQNNYTKPAHNFANTIGVGLSFNISDQINAEVNYSWKNFGSLRPLKNEYNEEISKKIAYKSNDLSVGLRFNL